jgi:hypothetical protein
LHCIAGHPADVPSWRAKALLDTCRRSAGVRRLEIGGDSLACTNVLHRLGGVWKIVHHPVDKSPSMGAALEKIAREE